MPRSEWSVKMQQALRPFGVSSLLLLCFVGIVVLAFNVWRELVELERLSTDNTQWALMQTEVEMLRLQLSVETAKANTNDADLTQIRRWFDVVYARVGMLAESDTYASKLLLPNFAPNVGLLQSFLNRTLPLIDAPDSELRAALQPLGEMLPEVRQAARRLTLTARTESAAASDARRNAVATTLLKLAILTAILLIALSGLALLFLRLMRRGDAQARENRLTSARLQAIFSTSADAIIVTNRGGWIVDINPAAEVVFGRARAESLGIHAFDVFLPPELAKVQSKQIEAIVERSAAQTAGNALGPLRIELLAMRANGIRFPVEMSLGTMQIASGGVIVALVRDISDRRQAQTALTGALEQAQAGEKAKADFIAVMSHEMRTPLNGLLGSLELLEATNLRGGQKDLVNVMAASGQILLQHVNSVLDISKAEADRMPDVLEPFDLDMLIHDCMANQVGLATTKGLEIRAVAPNGPIGWVMGEPARVQQILLNLIGNAVKFTAKGRITLEFERLGPGLPVEIRVIDSGIGISEADLHRVFDDFVTLDARYDRQAGGTGLGLGIARRVARALGGEIGVESVLGDGSLFWLRLPLPAVERTLPLPGDDSEPHPVTPAGQRVLVIEDNSVNRFVLRRLLEECGHEVTEAKDGATGVAAAVAQGFDLIMTDISMPGMDGVEVTRQIRLNPGPSQQARVVAVTAHALPSDLARFHEAGIDDCMTKPITRVSLTAAMNGQSPWAMQVYDDQTLDHGQISELQDRLGAGATVVLIARMVAEGDMADADDLWSAGAEGQQRLHALAGSAGTFGATAMQSRLAALALARAAKDEAGVAHLQSGLPAVWKTTKTALAAQVLALLKDQAVAAEGA